MPHPEGGVAVRVAFRDHHTVEIYLNNEDPSGEMVRQAALAVLQATSPPAKP